MTARCAVTGLDLRADAAGFVHEFVAADFGAAAVLLAGAVRATLLSVDFNPGQLPRDASSIATSLRNGISCRTRRFRKPAHSSNKSRPGGTNPIAHAP